LYTNRDSLSLGLVVTISALANTRSTICGMLEKFKAHPAVACLIQGGTVVEHSGHMVPEGGLRMMPPLSGDGVLLAGESAMMCLNLGYLVRGMDYAIAAGMYAGRTATLALEANDTSRAGLVGYRRALEQSFVLQDLRHFADFPKVMETTTRLYREYPVLVRDLLNALFIVTGKPQGRLVATAAPLMRRIGHMTLAKDLLKGARAL
jgi:electron transfer flavoprotein-quinone oxidoreductase